MGAIATGYTIATCTEKGQNVWHVQRLSWMALLGHAWGGGTTFRGSMRYAHEWLV